MKTYLKVWLKKCRALYSQNLKDEFWNLVQESMGSDLEPGGHLYNGSDTTGVFGVEQKKINKDVVKKIIRTTKKAYKLLQPERVLGDYEPTIDDLRNKKDSLFWLNVFNESEVKKISREKLLSAPVYLAEDLEGGAVLLVLNDDPWTCGEEIREKVRRHLFK